MKIALLAIIVTLTLLAYWFVDAKEYERDLEQYSKLERGL